MACDSSGRVSECRRAQDAKRDSESPFRLALDDSLRPRFTPLRYHGYAAHRVGRLAGNRRYPGSTFCVQSTIPRNTRRARRMEFDELSNRVMKCVLTAHQESLRVLRALRGETNRECEQDCGNEGKLFYQIALVEKSAAIAASSNEPYSKITASLCLDFFGLRGSGIFARFLSNFGNSERKEDNWASTALSRNACSSSTV